MPSFTLVSTNMSSMPYPSLKCCYKSEFDALSNAGMDTTMPGLGLVNEPCDPSYGSHVNDWRPTYQLAQSYGLSVTRQTHPYPDVSYHGSNWSQPLQVPVPQQRYPISYNHSGLSYPAMTTQTTPTVTPPVPTHPSPEFSALSSLSPPRTPASIALSVGNSPNIQPSRAITNSPQVSSYTFEELSSLTSSLGPNQERNLHSQTAVAVFP